MIDATSVEVDGMLSSQGIVVPVTEPTWFKDKLALLTSYGAAAMILKAAYPEASGPGSNPAYMFWETRYQQGLAAMRKGQDVPTATTQAAYPGTLPSSYFTRNPDEEEELGDLEGESMFKIGREW